MLWKKESNADGAMYTDLLWNTKRRLGNFPVNRKKDNALSIEARADGNQKYVENDLIGAMELYNQSICFAEKDSDNLSLAYANRASCFLKLKLYDRCLVDIQLAKAANYPDHLMSKLDARETKSLEKRSNRDEEQRPTLSFDPHGKYLCMADVLEIESNAKYGRLIRANDDIEIGDIILIEDAYIQMLHGTERNRCSTCMKENMNFIPCEDCADTMYCSDSCADNNFHSVECGMTVGAEDRYGGQSFMLIIRSLIIAINTFPTVAKLMKFVEKCRQSHPLDITEPGDTPIAKYRTFYKLATIEDNELVSGLLGAGYLIFHAIMGSILGGRFETEASQRFLMHLTIHHAIILRVNSFGGSTVQGTGTFGSIVDDTGKQQQQHVHLLSSYFNHACIPNVVQLVKDSVAICKALRPIKRGDQLFTTYICDEGYNKTAEARNDQLETVYDFRCACEYCQKADIHQPIDQLQTDGDFLFVSFNTPVFIQDLDADLLQELKDRCIAFLEKYPPKLLCSIEGAYITTILSSLMQKELEFS